MAGGSFWGRDATRETAGAKNLQASWRVYRRHRGAEHIRGFRCYRRLAKSPLKRFGASEAPHDRRAFSRDL